MAPVRSDLWKYATVVVPAAGRDLRTVKCIFCLCEYKTNNATRISAHLKSCKFVDGDLPFLSDQSTKDKGKAVAPLETAVASTSAVASTCTAANVSGPETTLVTRKYRKITDWTGKISENEKNHCDTELALAFFTGGVPFRFIENQHFLRAMGILRPGYEPPSRRQLSNQMLDDCYTSLQAKMKADIANARYVSLTTDAWTNVKGESVINFIILLPKPVFFEAVYTADNRHSSSYLSEITSNVIKEIGVEKVVAVVMDNAKANASAAKTLQSEYKGTPLTCVGCAAHWLNLLAKDITKMAQYELVLSQAVQAIRTFTNKQVVAAKLAELQRTAYARPIALQIPVETRWMSHSNALKSLIHSKTALQQFCVLPELSSLLRGEKEVAVKRNILSDDFWVQVTELRAQLEPISGAILQLEKNEGMLSDVYGQFKILADFYRLSSLPNAPHVLELFESRWCDYFTPAVAIAHVMNPANIGHHDDPLLMEKAEMYIREMVDEAVAPKIISSLWCYVSKSGGFTQEMLDIFAAGTPPIVWWSQCRLGAQHDALRSLAIKLLHVPATSAASERNWSAFRFIHPR